MYHFSTSQQSLRIFNIFLNILKTIANELLNTTTLLNEKISIFFKKNLNKKMFDKNQKHNWCHT